MQKEIIVIIGGPGTGKTTIIDGLVAKGHCCYPEISREVTLEAKKQGIEQLFLEKPLLFSELLLEGRKKQFQNATKEPHEIVFIDRGIPDVLAYMHISAIVTLLLLMPLAGNILTQKSLFFRLGKKFISAMPNVMKTSNKLNSSIIILLKPIRIMVTNS